MHNLFKKKQHTFNSRQELVFFFCQIVKQTKTKQNRIQSIKDKLIYNLETKNTYTTRVDDKCTNKRENENAQHTLMISGRRHTETGDSAPVTEPAFDVVIMAADELCRDEKYS